MFLMKVNKYLNKKIIPIVLSVFLVGGSFLVGFYFGGANKSEINKITSLKNKESRLVVEKVDFSPFWKAWNVINQKYVSSGKEITSQEKVWGAIQGLAFSLGDPYTVFMPPSESKIFNEDIKGNFGGVGMEIINKDEILTVVAPLKNSPAEKAGIKAGDKIVKIDGKMSADLSAGEAVKLIRGEIGTKTVISVAREGENELIDISIVRENIEIPTIKTEMKKGVFVISLYSFSAVSANLFRNALKEFVESGTNKLVLDLRGNPGGYMEAAIDMASWFLPAGKVVVKENTGDSEKVHRSKGYNIFNNSLKFAILIDVGSASASEILAGALKEQGVATLIGTRSFGKGSVQELVEITPETSLKVTVARWFTPNGISISKNGLTPDVEVKITRKDLEKGIDPQLEKAIEILNK